MELIGKGKWGKGIVWVALRVPDGYISAHANQARITTFLPCKDESECMAAADVVSFAIERGYWKGAVDDPSFSFSDTYDPVTFEGARFCEARVWGIFSAIAHPDDFDPKEYRMLMRAAKQAANEEDYREEERKEVEELEAFKERNKKKKSDETQKSLVESIIEAIVANLQVNIRHVHIRYEHHFAGYHPGKPETPFAVGITLDQLFLRPCDQAGKVGKAGKLGGNESLAGVSLIAGTGEPTRGVDVPPLFHDPWTPANGGLTATNKINRKPIEKFFKDKMKVLAAKGIKN